MASGPPALGSPAGSSHLRHRFTEVFLLLRKEGARACGCGWEEDSAKSAEEGATREHCGAHVNPGAHVSAEWECEEAVLGAAWLVGGWGGGPETSEHDRVSGRPEKAGLEGLFFEEGVGDRGCLARPTFPTSGQ